MALKKLNPLIKLVLVLLFSIGATILKGPLPLLALLLAVILYTFSGKNILRVFWRMKVMLITALLISLFSYLAGEGWGTVAGKTSAFLSIIAVSALYVETTDLTELSASMGKALAPLFGKSAWKFASSVMMTIAIFPMIFESANEMVRARRARRGSFIFHPFRNLTDYMVSLMRILFQKILIFQDAMYSRFYSPTVERTCRTYSSYDWSILILSTLALLLEVLWIKLG